MAKADQPFRVEGDAVAGMEDAEGMGSPMEFSIECGDGVFSGLTEAVFGIVEAHKEDLQLPLGCDDFHAVVGFGLPLRGCLDLVLRDGAESLCSCLQCECGFILE